VDCRSQIANRESRITNPKSPFTNRQLEVFRLKAGVLGDAGKHLGPDFLRIMERPGEFPFAGVAELNVRGTLLCLDGPTAPEKGDFTGFGARPVTYGQQAMEMSRGLSFFSFSISSASTRRARALTFATASCLLLP